eukprot:gnl/Spiro4/2382_TR1148_c0_g1_i1.p1 gnl/Spiro4/2382_TR1148_c0_g1~~gnl/Spiro4/2382_TR1148_c0_g1_i1.p1  ORF type:complete len:295 (-),score=77.81 gnl/Spiro4/2382_TR1148_c0_g1_i1:229-1080(-)
MAYAPAFLPVVDPGLPPPLLIVPEEARLAQFRALIARHEISDLFAAKLRQLEGYKIVAILDDSGSMNTPVDVSATDPYAPSRTRWTELQQTASAVIEIGGLLDRDGVDVYFLNREPVRNCTPFNMSGLVTQFSYPPAGYTPICRVFRQVLADHARTLVERKLLILLATDGTPTDDRGNSDYVNFENFLKNRSQPDRIPVSIMACTDEDEVMTYLNHLDDTCPSVDVCDDYVSERREVLLAQGNSFRFSRGDWIVKILLGSIDPALDQLDSRRDTPSCKGCLVS